MILIYFYLQKSYRIGGELRSCQVTARRAAPPSSTPLIIRHQKVTNSCFSGFPLPPKALHATQVFNSSVNVSWVPGFDSHSKIIRHKLRFRNGNTSKWNYETVTSTWKLFDLKFSTKAQFSVASENSIGVGKYSNILEVAFTSKGILSYSILW